MDPSASDQLHNDGGMGGPRRRTADGSEGLHYSYSYDHGTMMAANAEAQNIAHQLVQTNSVNSSNPNYNNLVLSSSNHAGNTGGAQFDGSAMAPYHNARSTSEFSAKVTANMNIPTATKDGTYYARMVEENNNPNNNKLPGGVASIPENGATSGEIQMSDFSNSAENSNLQNQNKNYSPPEYVDNEQQRATASSCGAYYTDAASVMTGGCSMETTNQVYVYNEHGQRVPYYDGPYLVVQHETGRKERRRWYGRIEDGYIAWISINLFEHFGAVVYQPLNPHELKRGKVPRWMYDMWSLPNLAIPLSYFCIGVALQLLRTPLIVYFISDLDASAADVNVLFTVMAVPWCFKVLYGFLSDCVPISGLRRKPYFMFGWIVYVLSNLILTVTYQPSIEMCIFFVFIMTAGYMLSDVMTDALIVERSQYETQANRGTMQSMGYIIRFFGSTVGATIGAVVYNKDDWDWYLPINIVFFLNAAFPLFFLLPVVPFLMEIETNCAPRDFWLQCRDLFDTAQLRAVWQPMTFVYVYNALQLTNAAWMNFLVEGLDFTAWMIGLVSIAGSIMSWAGIVTYKKFFFASNWRVVYFWCTTLASSIAMAQTLLVFGINRKWGIPDIWFSMGDDVLVEFVIAVQFLPMCIMYLSLCPEGSEGTTYAMLTTFSNLAGTVAFDISTLLTGIWDVSSRTIDSGDFSGVWKLSVLCGIIGPLPLILLGLIPKNKADQKLLQQDTKRHFWGGVVFIAVMILSLLVTFAESIWEVWYNDEGDDVTDNQRRRLSRLMVGH